MHQGVAQRRQPTFRLSMNSTLNAAMPRLRSSSIFSSVTSSLHSRSTSPVASSTTSSAEILVQSSSGSTGRRLELRGLELLDGAAGELAVLLDDHLAGLGIADVAGGALARQQVEARRTFSNLSLPLDVDGLGVVVVVEDLLGGAAELDRVLLGGVGHAAQGAEQHRRRQLAAPVDAHVEDVLVVELEVDPASRGRG